MNIKILGSGCPKCNRLEQKVIEYVDQQGLEDVVVEKITDLSEMLNYDILMTPGLIINGEVKSSGRIPSDQQLAEWLAHE